MPMNNETNHRGFMASVKKKKIKELMPSDLPVQDKDIKVHGNHKE